GPARWDSGCWTWVWAPGLDTDDVPTGCPTEPWSGGVLSLSVSPWRSPFQVEDLAESESCPPGLNFADIREIRVVLPGNPEPGPAPGTAWLAFVSIPVRLRSRDVPALDDQPRPVPLRLTVGSEIGRRDVLVLRDHDDQDRAAGLEQARQV